MVRKGQAAMEYLMTYGWAILVIVIVLAALLYLGVFNVGQRVPEQCNLPVGVLCTGAKLTSVDLTLTLRNGLGQKMTVCNIICNAQYDSVLDLLGDYGGTVYACDAGEVTGDVTIDVGDQKTMTGMLPCTNLAGLGLAVGEKYNGKLFLTYYLEGDTLGDPLRITMGDMQAVTQP